MRFIVVPRAVVRRVAACAAALLVVACAISLGGRPLLAVVAQYRDIPVYRVDVGNTPTLAITINCADGEDDMDGILDVLDRHGVHISFFLVGSWADRYPERARQLAQRGHDVQNHSQSHPHMNALGEDAIRREIDRASDGIEALTGTRPTLFRAPYGEWNDRVVRVARSMGYEVIQWDVDSQDWKGRGIGDMLPRVTGKIKNGSIVLFHNNTKDIVATLDGVLAQAIAQGYRVVTVPDLLLPGDTTVDLNGEQKPATR